MGDAEGIYLGPCGPSSKSQIETCSVFLGIDIEVFPGRLAVQDLVLSLLGLRRLLWRGLILSQERPPAHTHKEWTRKCLYWKIILRHKQSLFTIPFLKIPMDKVNSDIPKSPLFIKPTKIT